MYATTSSSGRDLQAMNEEVRHLTERRAELEEQELAAMLEQDPIDAELQALRERKVPVEQRVDELRTRGGRGPARASTPSWRRQRSRGRPRRPCSRLRSPIATRRCAPA